MKKKYIISRLVLILLLLTPYILKTYSSRLEPYPAVLFPVGGNKTKAVTNEFMIYSERRFFAVTKRGEIIKIDIFQLLNTVPRQFIYKIVQNNFGLTPKYSRSKGYDQERKRTVKHTAAAKEEGKMWIKNRLSEQTNVDMDKINGLLYQQCKVYISHEHEQLNREKCVVKRIIDLS